MINSGVLSFSLVAGLSGVALSGNVGVPRSSAQGTDIRREASLASLAASDLLVDLQVALSMLTDETSPEETANTADQLKGALEALSSFINPDTAETLSRVEHLSLLDQLRSLEVQPVPDPSVAILTAARNPDTSQSENLVNVLGDILLEALDLESSDATILIDAMKTMGIYSTMELIQQAARKGDWGSVVVLSKKLASSLFGPAGLKYLEEQGHRTVARRVALAVAARAVPYLGWGMLGVKLTFACYTHRDRLRSAVL